MLKPEHFRPQVERAIKKYNSHVISIEWDTEQFAKSVLILITKAIERYENRPEGMKHALGLNKHTTVILSEQPNSEIPLCSIYMNLHSDYWATASAKGSSKVAP